mmetsp:Transcript_26649/g.50288  ORF Transcript_26649/g.50288 Transcript_26649/m.50288 type:complete len:116 (+) Transcript_26649:1740-2087(+)
MVKDQSFTDALFGYGSSFEDGDTEGMDDNYESLLVLAREVMRHAVTIIQDSQPDPNDRDGNAFNVDIDRSSNHTNDYSFMDSAVQVAPQSEPIRTMANPRVPPLPDKQDKHIIIC